MGGWGQPKDLSKKKLTVENPDYVAPPTTEEGTRTETQVADLNTQQLLSDILVVMKKIEFHLSIVTDIHLKDGDIE